jgi:hypothetical protein
VGDARGGAADEQRSGAERGEHLPHGDLAWGGRWGGAGRPTKYGSPPPPAPRRRGQAKRRRV